MTAWLAALACLGLSGCASVGYYWQAVNGHLSLLQASRPIVSWLQDEATPERLKTRLALAKS